MLLPIIMLLLCAIGGAAVFFFLKMQKRRSKEADSAGMKTANEFVNVRDIQGNLLYTQDGMALCYSKITPISTDLYSKNEKRVLARSLTAEMSGNQDEFKLLAVSRPVDISPLLTELTGLMTSTTDRKQKELLRNEIMEMNAFAISGDIVERQFYSILWDNADEDVSRELTSRAKRFALNFTNCGVGCDLLGQQEIVRLCNLINNPAYSHLEDSDTAPVIPIISA
jgi:hypothetical protein